MGVLVVLQHLTMQVLVVGLAAGVEVWQEDLALVVRGTPHHNHLLVAMVRQQFLTKALAVVMVLQMELHIDLLAEEVGPAD